MALQAGAVPVKLGYIRSKLNRIDVYVAYSLFIAGTVLSQSFGNSHSRKHLQI